MTYTDVINRGGMNLETGESTPIFLVPHCLLLAHSYHISQIFHDPEPTSGFLLDQSRAELPDTGVKILAIDVRIVVHSRFTEHAAESA